MTKSTRPYVTLRRATLFRPFSLSPQSRRQAKRQPHISPNHRTASSGMENNNADVFKLLALPADVLAHLATAAEVKALRALMVSCTAMLQVALGSASGRLQLLELDMQRVRTAPSLAAWSLGMACQHSPNVHLALSGTPDRDSGSSVDNQRALEAAVRQVAQQATKVTALTLKGWDVSQFVPLWLLDLFPSVTSITFSATCTAHAVPPAATLTHDLTPLCHIQQLNIRCGIGSKVWQSWQQQFKALTGLQRFCSKFLPPGALLFIMADTIGQSLTHLTLDNTWSYAAQDDWDAEEDDIYGDEGEAGQESELPYHLILPQKLCQWFPQLLELHLPGFVAYDRDVDALLAHPRLQHVQVGLFQLSVSHAQQPCQWQTVGWARVLGVSSAQMLPLGAVRRIEFSAVPHDGVTESWRFELPAAAGPAAHMAELCTAAGGLHWVASGGAEPVKRACIKLITAGTAAPVAALLPVLCSYTSKLPTTLQLSGLRGVTAADWRLVVEQLQKLPAMSNLLVELHNCTFSEDIWPVLLQGVGSTMVMVRPVHDELGAPVSEEHLLAAILGAPRHARLGLDMAQVEWRKGWAKRLRAAAEKKGVVFGMHTVERYGLFLAPEDEE